jgi:membrane-associated phospholipid phosphatase
MSGFRLITVLSCMSFATNVWAQTEQTQDTKAADSIQAEKKDGSAEKKDDARVPQVQGQAADAPTAETAARPGKSSVQTDAPREKNSAGEQSKGTGTGLLRRFVNDQRAIWSSPAGLRFSDTEWLVPLSGITAGLFVTDSEFSRHLSRDPNTISRYKNLSNAGVGALVGGAAGMWLLGHASHNDHWSETGFLAGEAALNSLVIVEGLKYSLRRQRPFQGDGTGSFFQSGDTSFPSEHAAAAWSVAGIIAHEYPGPLTKIVAYGLASLVSVSRVKGRQHFPTDVVVGSVMGNLIAQSIYSRHHNPDLPGSEWRSISQIFRGDGTSSPGNQGSPYVPLDSWIYPVLDRLAGLGLIDSGFASLRPWTRRECTRLLAEAEEKSGDDENENTEAAKLVALLEREFRFELESADGGDNTQFRLESAYMRTENISGTTLNDGYHFAQTQINDFGRPYGKGWNTVTGFSAYSTSGRWSAYVRGEWQTAPALPALPLSARETIQRVDFLPQLPPNIGMPSVNQFRLLDAYVGLTASNWEVSFGKQSLWWGPGAGGAMLFTDNAEPINMFRINRVSPFQLPSIFRLFGPMRVEFFVGQLDGHHFINGPFSVIGSWSQTVEPQPFIHGQKLTFRPTRNLELGISRTTIFAGPGIPFTTNKLLRSLFNVGHYTGPAGSNAYPGDRLNALDFTYRIPKLRNWLTMYGDGYANDQIIFLPTGYPERAVWLAGIYLSRFPGLPKLDFRAEGGYTILPLGRFYDRGYYYSNEHYLSGYTNNGNILGSWIGRGGQGEQAWSNYWFTPRTRIQLNFRHQKVGQKFIPGGGSLTDVSARGDYWMRSNLSLSASVQYERWLFPVIQPNAQKNVSATVEIQFQPQKIFRRAAGGSIGAESGTGDRP